MNKVILLMDSGRELQTDCTWDEITNALNENPNDLEMIISINGAWASVRKDKIEAFLNIG